MSYRSASAEADIAQTERLRKVAGFLKGTRVLISGLVARPELNGTCGTILSFDAAKGRYAVRLIDVSEERILLKPAALSEAPGRTTAIVTKEPVRLEDAEDEEVWTPEVGADRIDDEYEVIETLVYVMNRPESGAKMLDVRERGAKLLFDAHKTVNGFEWVRLKDVVWRKKDEPLAPGDRGWMLIDSKGTIKPGVGPLLRKIAKPAPMKRSIGLAPDTATGAAQPPQATGGNGNSGGGGGGSAPSAEGVAAAAPKPLKTFAPPPQRIGPQPNSARHPYYTKFEKVRATLKCDPCSSAHPPSAAPARPASDALCSSIITY